MQAGCSGPGAELVSYLHVGRVLVARRGPQLAGHLQLTGTGQPGHAEGVTTVRVATAAADIGNLRFYQRQGFRIRTVKHDAFTESSGYPPGSQVAGIPLRDRVWLDIQLSSA